MTSNQILIEGPKFIETLGRNLGKHTKRNEDTSHINYKIHYLLHDPFTFVNAYAKISKNKGALTEGVEDDNVIQSFGLEKATNIAKKIKEDKYTFKPVTRTWIPKPGKKQKRPIDVPNQSDRIVQEAVRGILEAIYESVFNQQSELTNGLSNNRRFYRNYLTLNKSSILSINYVKKIRTNIKKVKIVTTRWSYSTNHKDTGTL